MVDINSAFLQSRGLSEPKSDDSPEEARRKSAKIAQVRKQGETKERTEQNLRDFNRLMESINNIGAVYVPEKIDSELCRWKLQRRILPNCLGPSNSR